MRVFQVALSSVALGLASGLAAAQMASTLGAERRAVPPRKAAPAAMPLQTSDVENDPRTDPALTKRIIDLYESGQQVEALELLSRIASGENVNLFDPCDVGGWSLQRAAVQGDFLSDTALDFEGNLLVGGSVGFVASVEKFTTEALPDGPERGAEWVTVFESINNGGYVDDIETDQDGFIYAGIRSGELFQDQMAIAKLATGGGVIWETQFSTPSQDEQLLDVVLGPNGVPVLATTLSVRQLNPYTGAVEWLFEDGLSPDNQVDAVAVDSIGDVYILTRQYGSNPNGLFLTRVSGASGQLVWSQFVRGGLYSNRASFIEIDSDDNILVSGLANQGFFVVAKLSSSGQPLWPLPLDFGGLILQGMTTDRSGNVFLLSYNPAGQLQPIVTMLNSDGQQQWQHVYTPSPALPSGGIFENRGDITLDRAGNVYFSVNYTGNHWIVRIDPSAPASPECQWSDIGTKTIASSITVDGAGSIYVTRYDADSSLVGLRKIEQTVDLPLEFASSPTFTLEDTSVWPGNEGEVVAETTFFDPSWGESIGIGGYVDGWFFDDTGAQLTLATAGQIQAGFKAEIEGGTVDMTFPIDALWETQGTAVAFGSPVDFDASWSMDPGASFTTCSEPDFNAGITAGLEVDLFANIAAKFDGDDLFNEDLLDLMVEIPNGYILSLGVFSSFIDAAGNNGNYVTIPTSIPGTSVGVLDGVKIRMRNPKLNAQGRFAPVSSLTSSSLSSSFARNEIAEIDFSVTNWLVNRYVETNPSLCPPLWQIPGTTASQICGLNKSIYSLDQSQRLDLGIIEIGARLELLQMKLQATFEVNQGINMEVTPKVRYVVRDGSGSIIPFQVGDGSGGLVTGNASTAVTLGDLVNPSLPDLRVPMPADGIIEIIPYIYGQAEFENNTGAGVIPGIKWTLFKMGLSARAFGFGLPSINLPEIGTRTDFGTLPISLFDGPKWVVNTEEIELSPIRVAGLPQGSEFPQLSAASRTSLPLIIYDQTSPSVSSFNNLANGVSKMLLYGERFSLPGEEAVQPVVKLSFQGQTETLVSERLNANTILVEIPNRFRLLPGVARLWVERDRISPTAITQSSGAIDLPIEFPVPRLDAVNPNLWAADPDMFTIPVQVIDRKTLLGSDTFITRRDYYVKLRDELWNNSTAGGVAADAYFPCFDFDQMPQFPTVLFGGNPLPRFIQPIDSGIHNVRLAERNYNTPGVIPVQICNPGPGGGVSETLTLNIAAPIPVASSLEPSEVEPGGELDPSQADLEIIVRGPQHVPTWDSYEEPKFSNFNAASQVYFDGELVPSRFVDSSELRAMVPDYLLQIAGNVRVEVFTPSNGSQYLEKKWSDPDGDGEFTSDTLAAIDSGGWSAPVFFPVRFRQPVIEELYPPMTDMGNPGFGVSTPQRPLPEFNFSVIGDNFREGAVLLVDGQPRVTQVLDRQTMNARLLPEDVANIGRRWISVLNPGRDGDVSEMIEFAVTTPKAAIYTRMGP